jgi:hypothetical protein
MMGVEGANRREYRFESEETILLRGAVIVHQDHIGGLFSDVCPNAPQGHNYADGKNATISQRHTGQYDRQHKKQQPHTDGNHRDDFGDMDHLFLQGIEFFLYRLGQVRDRAELAAHTGGGLLGFVFLPKAQGAIDQVHQPDGQAELRHLGQAAE